jgi:hypothetical protein
MVKLDNPAGRLYAILDEARKHPKNERAFDAWKRVLEVDDDFDVYRGIFHVRELVQEVKNLVDRLEVNKPLYLSRFERIERAVPGRNLETSWQGCADLLDEATMLSLAHLAELLSGHVAEQPIEKEELKGLEQDLDALFDKVDEGNLSPQLKEIILRQIEALLRSIREYRIRGAEGMKEALVHSYGTIIMNLGLFKKEKDSEEAQRFGKVLGKFEAITFRALQWVQIGWNTIKLLGYGG